MTTGTDGLTPPTVRFLGGQLLSGLHFLWHLHLPWGNCKMTHVPQTHSDVQDSV